jgi:hypothetical protein
MLKLICLLAIINMTSAEANEVLNLSANSSYLFASDGQHCDSSRINLKRLIASSCAERGYESWRVTYQRLCYSPMPGVIVEGYSSEAIVVCENPIKNRKLRT